MPLACTAAVQRVVPVHGPRGYAPPMKAQLPPPDAGLLAQVAVQTHTSVVVTDAQGRTVWVNPAFETLTGYALADVIGRKPGELLQCADTDREAVARLRSALQRGEFVRGMELLNVCRHGRAYWIRLDVSPVRDADGRITHFLSVQSDITEQRAEAARRQAEVQDALRDVERRDVLARLRREFRMPLNSLLGFAQLLRVEAEQGGQDSMAQRIEHLEAAGLQLLDMLDEMLAAAAADGERATLQPVNLWDALERHLPREVAIAGPAADAHPETVWADPVLLRRVIRLAGTMGLVPGQAGVGPQLELRADPGGRRQGLRFVYPRSVRPASDDQRMRMDLIQRVVLDMGGALELDETDACFRLTLYLRAAGEPRESAASEPPPAGAAKPASPWAPRPDVRGRVLYVEDDPGNVEIVRHALRSRPQVELLTAHSVDAAEQLLAGPLLPDLLLVDLMLPGRGGQALLELRARSAALSAIPCAVLTSVDDLAQEETVRALGVRDYLVKPLRLDRLLRLVDAHLGPRAA